MGMRRGTGKGRELGVSVTLWSGGHGGTCSKCGRDGAKTESIEDLSEENRSSFFQTILVFTTWFM